MKVIVCGAGQVGWQIARHLAGEGNDVTIIDSNAELVRRAAETLDVQGVAGFASYPDVLDRAGARDADMIIAATYSDEVNMIVCEVANSVFGVQRKIARLRAQSYLEPIYSDLFQRDRLSIDVVISPEKEVADAALQRLSAPAAFDTESFLDGRALLLGVDIGPDCPVIDTPLRQLTDLFSTLRAIVVGIRRAGRLFAPSADDQIFVGDQCYIFADTADMPRTMEIFGKTHSKIDRVVIIGGGNVGLAVAKALESSPQKIRVKMIEKSRARAEVAADALTKTIVLHGDGLDTAILDEASIATADAVLTLTDDDKTNLLAAVRAKQMGCKMSICLSNDPTLLPLVSPLGIDAYLNPRATTVSSILRHIRHGRVRGVYSIGDAEAEMIEAQVLGTSPLAGQKIKDIAFPDGVLVGGLMKGGKLVKPTGDLRIDEGDVIAIFAMAADVPEVERLLQVSVEFF